MLEYETLKSGTDIRGVAIDGIPGEPMTLTDDVIENIVGAFIIWSSRAKGLRPEAMKISVGHDSRISADRIRRAVIRALMRAGVHVIDCGLSSTPAMFMTTIMLHCTAAIQITASHHPYHRNGLKFFTENGGLEGTDISVILKNAQEHTLPPEGHGRVETLDFMPTYAKLLRDMIIKKTGQTQPLKGFHLIVDAGNGVGGFYARDVLEPLGADISGSQFLEPDGMFPNHIPNPENKEAMASISMATLRSGADLGIIFDTDVDRASCVDQEGHEINRNRIVALAAAIALKDCPGGTIVTDSVTSSGLKLFIENILGGKHHRFKRGYKNVIDEAIRLSQEGTSAPLAIETSGHAAFAENYYLDDGAYLITKIIIAMALLKAQNLTISDLIADLMEPAEAIELRFRILEPDFHAYGEQVIQGVTAYAAAQGWDIANDNHEGIRVSIASGWFLLRLSVHDPIMPLNIESDLPGDTRRIALKLYECLRQYDRLDLTPLEDLIHETR